MMLTQLSLSITSASLSKKWSKLIT